MRITNKFLLAVAVAVAALVVSPGVASAKTALIRQTDDGLAVTYYYSGGSTPARYNPVASYPYRYSPVARPYYGPRYPFGPFGHRYVWRFGYTTYPYTYADYPYSLIR